MAPSHINDCVNVLRISPIFGEKSSNVHVCCDLERKYDNERVLNDNKRMGNVVVAFRERLGNVALTSVKNFPASTNVCLAICERAKRLSSVCLAICERAKRLSSDGLTFYWRSRDVSSTWYEGRWQTVAFASILPTSTTNSIIC